MTLLLRLSFRSSRKKKKIETREIDPNLSGTNNTAIYNPIYLAWSLEAGPKAPALPSMALSPRDSVSECTSDAIPSAVYPGKGVTLHCVSIKY